jgi:hypothetical protein
LSAEGIFCQWLPLYQLSPEQLAIIIRTFLDVFPRNTLWRGNFVPDEATLALVGHLAARPLDPEAIDARVRALAASTDSNPFLEHPAGMWLFLVGPLSPQTPWYSAAPQNTDREPWIELRTPISHAGRDHAARVPDRVATFLEQVARAPCEDSLLGGLDDRHQAWRAAGAALWTASRTQDAEGKKRILAILQTLPPELQRSLEVDDSPRERKEVWRAARRPTRRGRQSGHSPLEPKYSTRFTQRADPNCLSVNRCRGFNNPRSIHSARDLIIRRRRAAEPYTQPTQ